MACMRPMQLMFHQMKIGGGGVTNITVMTRALSTSSLLHKKTPATVGTHSWVRSARRRKFLVKQMVNTEKTEHQILREEQLARQRPEVKFRLPAKERTPIENSIMEQRHITPQVFLSTDRKTIICYHPPPKDYPFALTKPAYQAYNQSISTDLATFRNEITPEEIEEGKLLREKDPVLWSYYKLSELFRVEKHVVEKNVPSTSVQLEREAAENELVNSMSQTKRKSIETLRNQERRRYQRKTRPSERPLYRKRVGDRMPRPPRF